ncbi:MAG: histidinol-phosphate transaminase [Syntrophales bacterium]|jgi:histidinol-phosphate aminotransferase
MDYKKLVREEVLAQKAYSIELVDCRIKLDANENPYGLSDELRSLFLGKIAGIALNRYPEPGSRYLVSRLATYLGVDQRSVLVGNGSDEIIQMICMALGKPGACMVVPTPTFVMYRITGRNLGWRVIEVPLDEHFDLDQAATLEAIALNSPSLIFLSSPNNPTGNCFSSDKIEKVIAAAPGIVVVDEAYGAFSGRSLLPLMREYGNLVILRTLSKVGMAAMRIGFLIAPLSLAEEFHKVRLPYNLNTFSQAAAVFYLDHETVFSGQINDIIQEREKLIEALRNLKGIHPWPSHANFIFFSCDFESDHVYNYCIQNGILMKDFNGPGMMENCLRVTVGTQKENKEFINTIQSMIAKM